MVIKIDFCGEIKETDFIPKNFDEFKDLIADFYGACETDQFTYEYTFDDKKYYLITKDTYNNLFDASGKNLKINIFPSYEESNYYRQETEKDLAAVEKKINTAVSILLDHPSDALTEKLTELEAKRKVLQSRLKSLTERNTAAIDPEALINTTMELSSAILDVLRSPTASPDAKRNVLLNFVRSIVVDKKGNVIINYLPPGYTPKVVTQCDIVPPENYEETGEVVTQSARNLSAPPEGVEPPTS